jgi:hypothetical protein
MMDPIDSTERRINIAFAIGAAAFSTIVFLPLWIWGLPWLWALLIAAIVCAVLFEAKRRWDFSIWDYWWIWLPPWWW